MIGAGVLFGIVALVISSQAWIDNDPTSMDWWTTRFQAAGAGLLGLVFLVASFAALRNRRRAGLIFLGNVPLVAFLLSYPNSGYWMSAADGGTVFDLVPIPIAVGLSCLFYVPFVALVWVNRDRRRVLWVFLIATMFAVPIFVMSSWTAALLPHLAGWSAPFLIFGGFWLETGRRGWPARTASEPRSLTRRLVVAAIQCLAVAVAVGAGTFLLATIRSSLWTADCSGPSLFVRPLRPGHTVFTARIIWAGHTSKVSGKWAGDWAIGAVQEHFWGLPSWARRYVLMTNHPFRNGETFFVSGFREEGMLTRFLPMVDIGRCGSRYAQPVDGAKIQLQLVRQPPPTNELRIMGYALSPLPPVPVARPRSILEPDPGWDVYQWLFAPPTSRRLADVRIRATSPSGTMVVKTDRDGMYMFSGLQPDTYTLSLLDVPDNQTAADRILTKKDLVELTLVRLDIHTDWDGSIEGRIVDARGAGARAWLQLQNVDGTPVALQIAGLVTTAADGSFRFVRLPTGGRYKLLINPNGPGDDFPYPRQYYRGGGLSGDPRIFEIEGSNHIQNVNMALNGLIRRDLKVHVTWADGRPADDASVSAGYEHTEDYEDPSTSPQVRITDQAGVAGLSLFGDSRIRIQARGMISGKTGPDSFRYSQVAELQSTALPPRLDLVLSSSVKHRSR